MHYVIESATDRRTATAGRITLCAQRLTDEHGLDGFTMDDLAAAAEVSRRTLFNYFPGKVDAVLGLLPDLAEARVVVFRDGGPGGDLVADLRALIGPLFDTELLSRETLERGRRVMLANPRLLTHVHDRYVALSAEIVAHIEAREGPTFGVLRARVAVRMLAALFDSSLDEYLTDAHERSLSFHFDESLRTARSLLGA